MLHTFQKFTQKIAAAVGSPYAFIASLAGLLIWAAAGSSMKYSTDWQMLMNTPVSLLGFLILLILQSTANRDAKIAAINQQNILRALPEAPNTLLALDEETPDRLEELQGELKAERAKAEEEGSSDGA